MEDTEAVPVDGAGLATAASELGVTNGEGEASGGTLAPVAALGQPGGGNASPPGAAAAAAPPTGEAESRGALGDGSGGAVRCATHAAAEVSAIAPGDLDATVNRLWVAFPHVSFEEVTAMARASLAACPAAAGGAMATTFAEAASVSASPTDRRIFETAARFETQLADAMAQAGSACERVTAELDRLGRELSRCKDKGLEASQQLSQARVRGAPAFELALLEDQDALLAHTLGDFQRRYRGHEIERERVLGRRAAYETLRRELHEAHRQGLSHLNKFLVQDAAARLAAGTRRDAALSDMGSTKTRSATEEPMDVEGDMEGSGAQLGGKADWLKFMNPTALPLHLAVGTVKTTRGQFEETARIAGVPKNQMAYALRRCLTAQQFQRIKVVRQHPITGVESVQQANELGYDDLWRAIAHVFDDETAQADALAQLNNVIWDPHLDPRGYGEKLVSAASRVNIQVNKTLLFSLFMNRMLQPLRSCCDKANIHEAKEWDKFVDIAYHQWRGMRESERAEFRRNLKTYNELLEAANTSAGGEARQAKRSKVSAVAMEVEATAEPDLTQRMAHLEALVASRLQPTASSAAAKPKAPAKAKGAGATGAAGAAGATKSAAAKSGGAGSGDGTVECFGCHQRMPRGELDGHKRSCRASLERRIAQLQGEGKPTSKLEAILATIRKSHASSHNSAFACQSFKRVDKLAVVTTDGVTRTALKVDSKKAASVDKSTVKESFLAKMRRIDFAAGFDDDDGILAAGTGMNAAASDLHLTPAIKAAHTNPAFEAWTSSTAGGKPNSCSTSGLPGASVGHEQALSHRAPATLNDPSLSCKATAMTVPGDAKSVASPAALITPDILDTSATFDAHTSFERGAASERQAAMSFELASDTVPSAATDFAAATQHESSKLRVVELCSGIGGQHEGLLHFAAAAGVTVETVLAVDHDAGVCAAYRALNPDVPVLCKSLTSQEVRNGLHRASPDLIWITAPCSDFSAAGKRIEGEAAQCTVQATQLVVDTKPALACYENVPSTPSSQSWSVSGQMLVGAGYSLLQVRFKGTDVSGGSTRDRVYVIAAAAPYTSRLEKVSALMNECIQNSVPLSVRDILPDVSDTFYWDPRQHDRAGVLSSDMPLPSPVSRQPGRKPSVNYVPRPDDAGPVSEASVLTAQQVAKCLGFHRELPAASAAQHRRWVADLVQPLAVSTIMQCLHAVAPLPSGWDVKPTCAVPGTVLIHDHTAPPPEWVTDSTQDSVFVCTMRAIRSSASKVLTAVTNGIGHLVGTTCTDNQSSDTPVHRVLPSNQWYLGECEEEAPVSFDFDYDPFASDSEAADEPELDQTSSSYHFCSIAARRTSGATPIFLCRHKPAGKPRRNGFISLPVRTQVGNAIVEQHLEALVDCGAEAEFISTTAAAKLPTGSVCPLSNGDYTTVEVANKGCVPVKGVYHAQLRFGTQVVEHPFYVVDLPYEAILGTKFFGLFGSVVSYETDMSFFPFGSDGPAFPMHERGFKGASPPAVGTIKLGAGRLVGEPKTANVARRILRAATDTILPPFAQNSVEVLAHPPLSDTMPAEVLLTADAPEVMKMVDVLAKQQTTLVDTAAVAHAHSPLYMAALNDSPLPVFIRKGSVVGVLEQPDLLANTTGITEDDLTARLTAMALNSIQCVQPATVASVTQQASESSGYNPSPSSQQSDTERVAYRQQVADEHNAGIELCTDDELRELLMKDGEVLPSLQGKDDNGVPLFDRMMDILKRHRAIFAKDPLNPPVTSAFDVTIDTGDAQPIADKARKWAEREAKFIMDHIAALHQRKQIQPASGPWACNPVLVVQNGKVRFCVDYRKLNKVTKRDEHGLGNIDNMMQRVARARFFTALDLARGYHQIPMAREAAAKTAFRAPDGSLWEYKVAPFGLVCLPSIFTRSMHQVLGDALDSHACVYVDDVLTHSQTVEQHLQHLDDVFSRIEKFGMSVSRHKCQLFQKEVTYLGHRIGWWGMRPCPDKVKAMVDMSPPVKNGKADKRLVQVVLGCFNYYRRYVHRFAELAAPLVECTKDGADMSWNRRRQEAFRKLKQAMASAPILMHPDFELPFTVHTDASKVAVAGVLTQFMPVQTLSERCKDFPWASMRCAKKQGDKPVTEVVISFFSKINSVMDAKLGATALECLAVVLALNHFRAYVWGRPVTVVTDASALRWLLSLNDNNGKLLRWAMRLQEFDIMVIHRPGKQNSNADCPSRLPQMVEVLAPQPVQHADEQWPDCTEVGDAPPSGVHFQDNADAMHVASIGCYDVVATSPAIRFNTLACASPQLAHALLSLNSQQAFDLLNNTADEHSYDAPPVILKEGEVSDGHDFVPDMTAMFYNLCTGLCSDNSWDRCAALVPRTVGDTTGDPMECDADGPVTEQSGVADDTSETSVEQPDAHMSDADASPATLPSVAEHIPPAVLQRANFVQWQARDPFCCAVKNYLQDAELPGDSELAAHILLNKEFFTLDSDGLLVHCAASTPKRGKLLVQWVVPAALRPLVLRLTHDDASAQHPSTAATHVKAFERFYWRGMGADIRDYVRTCVACQQTKPPLTSRYKQALMPPRHMWQRLHIDFSEPGVISDEGHRYLLVIVEARSGYCWIFPTKTRTVDEIAPLISKVILESGSLVEELCSDRASEFMSTLVNSLCQAFAVRKIETSAYHPQSNGIVENMNGRIKRALARWCSHHQGQWHLWLDVIQFALRTTPREETGLTPFFCVFGREARFPVDAFASESQASTELHLEVARLMENMQLADKVVGEALELRAKTILKRNEKVLRALHLQVGDYVWLKKPPTPGRAAALEERFTGPWLLEAANGDSGLSFQCRLMGTRIRHTTAHVEHMKPYHQRPAHLVHEGINVSLTSEQLAELPQHEHLHRLLGRKAEENGSWSYRWQARDGSDSEWVHERELVEMLNVPPWVLDTFHALYELTHADHMPTYAKRLKPQQDSTLRRDEALRKYPIGTEVVRETRLEDGTVAGATEYIWGTIQSFARPYWRVRYSDGQWEDLTSTLVKRGMLLAEGVRGRMKRLAQEQPTSDNATSQASNKSLTGDQPQDPSLTLRVFTCPHMPNDFGAKYVGHVIRYRFPSGWSRGTLKRFVSGKRNAEEFNFEVEFPNSSGRAPLIKTLKLRSGYYADDRDAAQSSWNLLLSRLIRCGADASEALIPITHEEPDRQSTDQPSRKRMKA